MTYCDVSLPVPLDQSFTYRMPETLRHRVRPGCRVLVPFGFRKLTGIVLKLHDQPPDGPVKEVFRLIDEEPVIEIELVTLGRWIAQYYCSPLGEVLRGMTPLTGEIRKTKLYSLTDSGRDAARQLLLGSAEDDPTFQVLRLLESRPLSASYLQRNYRKPQISFDRSKRKVSSKSRICKHSVIRCAPPLLGCARHGWLRRQKVEAHQAGTRAARFSRIASGKPQSA